MFENSNSSPTNSDRGDSSDDECKRPFKLVCRGKLPNSSYYDVVIANNNAATPAISRANSVNGGSVSRHSSTSSMNNNHQHDPQAPNGQAAQNGDGENNNEGGQENATSNNSNTEIWSCIFSPDNTHLAWSCGYGIVKIMKWSDSKFRKRTKSEMKEAGANDSKVYGSSPSGGSSSSLRLNSVDEIAEIDCGEMVWSLAFGSPTALIPHKQVYDKQSRVYTRFNLSKYKLLLAVGLVSGKIRIYDAITGQFLLILFDHKDLVSHMKFSKDGSLQLASVSRDETIKLWDMFDDGNMYKTLKKHISRVNCCDWSPVDSKMLVSVGVNRQAYIWDLESFSIKHTLTGHLHDVVSCEFSPDGALVATASYDTKIFLWDPYSGQLVRKFYHMLPPPRFIYAGGHNGSYVRSIAFSSSGDHFVSICDDKKIRVWSTCSRSLSPVAEGSHNDALCMAYSTNTRALMIGTRHGQVDVYETPLVVQRLKHVCRVVVNQYVCRSDLSKLGLPNELVKYLMYEDIKEHVHNSSPPATANGGSHHMKPATSPTSIHSLTTCH